MEIKIKDVIVETKEILSIEDYTRDRFWNRHCGFKIELYKKDSLIIEWPIAYETTTREIHDIKQKCLKLMESVIAEWEKDKVVYPEEPKSPPMPMFNLNQ